MKIVSYLILSVIALCLTATLFASTLSRHSIDFQEPFVVDASEVAYCVSSEVTYDSSTVVDMNILKWTTEVLNGTYKVSLYIIEDWEYGNNYPGEIINMSTPVLVDEFFNEINSSRQFCHIITTPYAEEYLYKVVLLKSNNGGSSYLSVDTDYIVTKRISNLDFQAPLWQFD